MDNLSQKILTLVNESRELVVRTTNTTMISTYFLIGKLIIEGLQDGEKRAGYGKKILKNVSKELTEKLGRGFSTDNLENMRNFYQAYSNQFLISENSSRISYNHTISEKSSRKFENHFLSWSHYVFLIKIEDKIERKFYEIEALENNWSIKELTRQFNSGLFERVALSKNNDEIKELAKHGQNILKPQDIIKDPLILEFLGFEEKSIYSETDLETAIINDIEKFMLELGKGFFFGGRQVRFTFDEEHYYIDLVFYNRILKCFVIIDLKIGKLKHQDLGQMQMYVNYYDRYIKNKDENPTIGIIVCKNKNKTIVELTLPVDNNQIFATKYQSILPKKDELKKLLEERDD